MPHYAEAIGLDLGTHSAKIAHVVRRRGVCTVTGTARIDLPPEVPDRRQAVRRMVQARGWAGLPCVVSLRGDAVILRAVEIPPSDPRSLRQVMSVELKEFDSLSSTETVSHCTRMPAPDGYRRALLAVSRADAVGQVLETPGEVGLHVMDVAPAAVALANTFTRFAGHETDPVLFVDLARDGTEVVVIRGKALLFSRSLSIGADVLLSSTAAHGVSRTPEMAAWVEEIQSCLTLFRSQFPKRDDAPSSVILSGGAGAVEGLRPLLAAAVDLDVRLFEDLLPDGNDSEAAFFATAIGLALTGLGEGPVASSLLPAPLKERRVLHGQMRYWVLSAVAVVLAMTFLVLRGYRELDREDMERQAREKDLAERLLVAEELTANRAEMDRLQTRVTAMEVALRNGEVLRSVMEAVTQAKDGDDWITLIADSYTYFAGALSSPTGALGTTLSALSPAALSFEQIVVEGYTPVEDLSTVRAMIGSLREHPAVLDADLLGDDRLRQDPHRDTRWAPTECILFAIEITVPPL